MSPYEEHTWDIHLEYLRCKQCGKIFEDRSSYKVASKQYEKQGACPFCQAPFTITKPKRSSFAPFFGKEEPPEILWP